MKQILPQEAPATREAQPCVNSGDRVGEAKVPKKPAKTWVTLVESVGERAKVKGEDLDTKGTTFYCAVSRATLAPQEWLNLGTELVLKGRVFVLLAKIDDPEKAGWDKSAECHYQWPGSKGGRRIVEYREHVGGH